MCGREFMVWEAQIRAPTLNGKGNGQRVMRNGRTLDMPTGAPVTEHIVVPIGFAFTAGRPHQWVKRIALARSLRVTAAFGEELGHLLVSVRANGTQLPWRLLMGGFNRKVDIVIGYVRVPLHRIGSAL